MGKICTYLLKGQVSRETLRNKGRQGLSAGTRTLGSLEGMGSRAQGDGVADSHLSDICSSLPPQRILAGARPLRRD